MAAKVKTGKQTTKSAKPSENESEESDFEDQEEGGMSVCGVYIPPVPQPVCSAENIGPRLIITHIVNINFKSYAGRQVLGPFNKNFTSIVGPNGSGKSNVIDSMLFVFGYRATKIRSKKLSVLIHNSEKYKNVRSCTVEVHFVQIRDKGDTDYEIVPNSNIVVSRTANTDNQSQYAINGKNVRFKEVAILLRSHGIDLIHNRFLILQGEVEQIAMMKPKAQTEHDTGMLEYLEEIIGTNRYKVPIAKIEIKLEQLNVERQEKQRRRQMAEKEVVALEGPASDALQYLMKENEHTVVKNKMHQAQLHECLQKLEKCTGEKESLENNLTEIKQKIESFNEDLAIKEKKVSKRMKNLDALKCKRDETKDSIAKAEKQSTELKLDITHTNQKNKKAIETKKQMEQKLVNLKNIPEKNTKDIKELKVLEEKLIKSRAKEEDIVAKTLSNLQLETQGLQDNLSQLSNKLIGLKSIRDDASAKYQVEKKKIDVYMNKEVKEKEKLDKLKSTLEEINNRLKEEHRKSSDAVANLPSAEKELVQTEKISIETKENEVNLKQELNKLMAKVQEKKNMMHDRKSRGRVLEFIMKQKESGVVPGVFGRLGDLGGIDAKYDCAISTACGPLDYIVTDTVKTGKRCVELLKINNIGRGNFIALDQQEGLKSLYMKPIKTPENVPRLFDLIKVNDERVRPAFYFGLRDTLAATDLAQAKRCAYGLVRYRVVTLNGEIIEIAGTMSGGGREKRTGRMGRVATVATDVSSDDLNNIEQQIVQMQEKLAQVHQKRMSVDATIARLSTDIKSWKTNLNSSDVEIQGLEQRIQQLSQHIKNQEAIVLAAAVNPENEDMTEGINKLKEEFDVANKNSSELEAEVKKVKAQIDAATGGKMKEVRQKLEKIITQLNKVTAEITRLGVEIKTVARDESKTVNRINSLTTEINMNEENILKAEEFVKVLKEKIEKLLKNLEASNDEIDELVNEIRELKTDSNGLNKELASVKALKLTEDQKMEAIEKSVKESEQLIASKKKQIAALKINTIPDLSNLNTSGRQLELVTYTREEVDEFDVAGLRYLDMQLEEQLNKEKSNVNLNLVQELIEKKELLALRQKESKEVTAQRNDVKKGLDEVRKARLNEFMTGFTLISSKLKEMYQMITLGGDAELDLADTLDPFEEGVVFSVRPPKKSWKNISTLSGGEKTLSSLALVFALHYYRPSPLYVMDEIDAALDSRNVSIVAHYIKERTKNAQFIIISLRSNMFEHADVLVGIYKTFNCSKSVTITPALYLQ